MLTNARCGLVAVALAVSAGGATASNFSEPRPVAVGPGDGEEGGVVREPMAWGCSADVVAVAPSGRNGRANARTPIPPPVLQQDVSNLRLGRPFPAGKQFNLPVSPDHLTDVEREFCKRDDELVCPTALERHRLVADLLERTALIASRAAAGSAEQRAAQHVHDDLLHDRLPIIQFNTTMRSGPTAGIIRFQDARSGKWILGIAFARDFVSANKNKLFLDGVIVQEMVHYDDLSFLPDPLRCYESNIEIRGHYAMMDYWKRQARDETTLHPRIGLVMSAGLDAGSRRAKWYQYLNQVEKTNFLVEDELVTLEFRSLPGLSTDRSDDERFLGELSRLVKSALGKAIDVRGHVANMSSDTINANARVISAVSRLMPRVLGRYQRARGDLRDADGTLRRAAMSTQIADIQRSLTALNGLMGVLAADPDFRKKSEFVGPD